MERLKRMFDTGDGRQAEGAIDRESALSGLGYVNIDVAAVHREIVPKHHETSESVSTASRTQRLCVRKLYKPTGRVSSRLVARRSAAVSRWTLGHIGGTVRTHTDCHTLTGGSVIWMPVGLALPLGGVRTIG